METLWEMKQYLNNYDMYTNYFKTPGLDTDGFNLKFITVHN
jgi:hypothetical protein